MKKLILFALVVFMTSCASNKHCAHKEKNCDTKCEKTCEKGATKTCTKTEKSCCTKK